MAMLFVSMETRYTIYLHSCHCCAILLLTTPWHNSSTYGESMS